MRYSRSVALVTRLSWQKLRIADFQPVCGARAHKAPDGKLVSGGCNDQAAINGKDERRREWAPDGRQRRGSLIRLSERLVQQSADQPQFAIATASREIGKPR
jgi:hypothetical protein